MPQIAHPLFVTVHRILLLVFLAISRLKPFLTCDGGFREVVNSDEP